MTAERYRTPMSVPQAARGFHSGSGAEQGFFVFNQADRGAPHPSFEARAAIWKDQRAGLISLAEAQRRSAAIPGSEPAASRVHAPLVARPPVARPRHQRPAPNKSRQYAGTMATTAARDDRLTPNAKAFLQVLRARCGKGRETTITKGTAGAIMSRSPRTIRRYLVDLVRFGYVEVETLRNARGLHLGLVVRIAGGVLPFFDEAKALAGWLAETPGALARSFTGRILGVQGVTLLSPKNQIKDHHLKNNDGKHPETPKIREIGF